MHEFAICQEMLSQVNRIATEHGATSVDRIIVVIGPLSGVEIPLLQRAFSIARASTVAENAEFDCEPSGIRVHCRSCGDVTAATINNLTCNRCGDWRVDVQQGDEMLLKTLELSGIPDRDGAHAASKTTAETRDHV